MITDELRQYLVASKRPKILVAGDIVLDKFIWGRVERISPEAPVQVVSVERENIALGGAANVANNLVRMGATVTMMGVIGSDTSGDIVRMEFDKMGLAKEGLFIDVHRPTTEKTRVIAGHQQVVRIDRETTAAISDDIENRAIQFLSQRISECEVIVISDYHKGFLTDRLLQIIIQSARDRNVPVLVDPKRSDFAPYSGATLIKPNARETETVVGRPLRTYSDFLEAAREIRRRYACDNVLITRSCDGMVLIDNSRHYEIPATAKDVFDVTGAGDTVTAFYAMMLGLGASHFDAARLSNVAAGLAVNRVGTVTVSRAEVLRELESLTSGSGKIITLEECETVLPQIRRDKKVVFTNGCFDILHVGHVSLLNQARALGDVLIVGVNTDASIRRIKGEKRPIVREGERAHVLAALEAVDYVVLFDEDTPIRLIESVKPDILVKGSDYRPDEVVGKEIVEKYGGRVELVPLVEGFSTTNIVNTILKHHEPSH